MFCCFLLSSPKTKRKLSVVEARLDCIQCTFKMCFPLYAGTWHLGYLWRRSPVTSVLAVQLSARSYQRSALWSGMWSGRWSFLHWPRRSGEPMPQSSIADGTSHDASVRMPITLQDHPSLVGRLSVMFQCFCCYVNDFLAFSYPPPPPLFPSQCLCSCKGFDVVHDLVLLAPD